MSKKENYIDFVYWVALASPSEILLEANKRARKLLGMPEIDHVADPEGD